MRSPIQQLVQKNSQICTQALAQGIGKLYVQVYDCMYLMRFFI